MNILNKLIIEISEEIDRVAEFEHTDVAGYCRGLTRALQCIEKHADLYAGQDIVRVLRVYEFVGPRDKIEVQIANSIHGSKEPGNGVTIHASTVGVNPAIQFPVK